MDYQRLYLLLEIAQHLRGLPNCGNMLQLVMTDIRDLEAEAKVAVAERMAAEQEEANKRQAEALEAAKAQAEEEEAARIEEEERQAKIAKQNEVDARTRALAAQKERQAHDEAQKTAAQKQKDTEDRVASAPDPASQRPIERVTQSDRRV